MMDFSPANDSEVLSFGEWLRYVAMACALWIAALAALAVTAFVGVDVIANVVSRIVG